MLDLEDPSVGLLPTCRELGVTIVAYSPIGRGFLSGQIKQLSDVQDPFRGGIPRFTGENFPKVLEIVAHLEKIAEKKGVSPSQVSIAWVLAQDDTLVAIPGTRTIKYLEQNSLAAEVTLSAEEIKEIRDAVERAGLTGHRSLGT